MALGAFFAVAGGIAACGSSVPGNSVADVAGNPITLQAFNHWMYVAAKSQAAQQLAYLFVSHDLSIVRKFVDRVIVMYAGRVIESGPIGGSFQPLHKTGPAFDVFVLRRS